MKKIISKLMILTISTIAIFSQICFSDSITTWERYYLWDPTPVSWINLPWITEYNWEWWNELLIMAKRIFNRALEYLPVLVLILLLFACLKMIFEWDWKSWFKRIKYILIWVAIMILSIYIMNVVSTIISWYPIINIHFNRWY